MSGAPPERSMEYSRLERHWLDRLLHSVLFLAFSNLVRLWPVFRSVGLLLVVQNWVRLLFGRREETVRVTRE